MWFVIKLSVLWIVCLAYEVLTKGEPLFLAELIHVPVVLQTPPIPTSPIMTVGHPIEMMLGGPASQIWSPIRQAGMLLIMTVGLPVTTTPET